MAAALFVVAAVLAALCAERAFELVLDRRNARWLARHGARFVADDGFGLIVVAQVTLIAGTAFEASAAPWAAVGWWTWAGVALLAIAQAARYSAIAALGRRWCVRVATLPGAPRVTGGPYRFMAHPNYAAVALEALALPFAFHAWSTLAIAGTLTLVALARRIRREERALRANAPPSDGAPRIA